MNAKKVKALRKLMRNLDNVQTGDEKLVDLAYREDNSKARTIVVSGEELKTMGYVPKEGEDFPSINKVKTAVGPISHDPKSKRGIYRHFKQKVAELS